jgi:hypothetical protein
MHLIPNMRGIPVVIVAITTPGTVTKGATVRRDIVGGAYLDRYQSRSEKRRGLRGPLDHSQI